MHPDYETLRDECIMAAGILCQVDAGLPHLPFLMQSLGRLMVRAGALHQEISRARSQASSEFDAGQPRLALLEHLERERPQRKAERVAAAKPEVVEAAQRARMSIDEVLRMLSPAGRILVESRPKAKTTRRSTAKAVALAPANDSEGPALKGGARRMLRVLGEFQPLTLTRYQIGFLAGVKSTTGTFGNYWAELKAHGLIREAGHGCYSLTQEGIAASAGALPALRTYQGRADYFASKLKGGARRMLIVLIKAGSHGLEREALGVAAGVSATTGTYGNYLGLLRSNELITTERSGPVRIHPWLSSGKRS